MRAILDFLRIFVRLSSIAQFSFEEQCVISIDETFFFEFDLFLNRGIL